MTEDSRIFGTFLRTDDQGRLIFKNTHTNECMIVEITDDLEQGILAGKQIKRDLEGVSPTRSEKVLPISTIQSLVRAGHNLEEVATMHNISVALVKRFATTVEAEKRFIIAQFLDNSPHNDTHNTNIAEIILSSMASLGADYNAINWKASREGHDPWRIQARYTLRDREETAEWMFNAHDRSVVCVNLPAKRLLGEVALSTSPVDKELFTNTDAVPVVTAQSPVYTDSHSSAQSDAVSSATGSFETVDLNHMQSQTHMSTGAFNAIIAGNDNNAHQNNNSLSAQYEHNAQPQSYTPHMSRDTVSHSSHDNNYLSIENTDIRHHENTSDASATPINSTKKKRSAIPAWDDILFGSEQ